MKRSLLLSSQLRVHSKNKKRKKKAEAAEDAPNGKNPKSGKVITDSRFASMHSDPRFQRVPKHKAKLEIDSRFDRMFSDKSFTSSSGPLDKRGKPKKQTSQNLLSHYYRLEEEAKNQAEMARADNDNGNDESEYENLQQIDCSSLDSKLKSESEDSASESEPGGDMESDSSSTTATGTDEEDYEYSESELQEENIPEIEKGTHRLAVVNMDWSQVKATDLYVALSSFLPKDGQILSVAVYPSEFGLKRMEEENLHGPVALFGNDKESVDDDDDDENDQIDEEKLRAYEKSRLRYYYAVVECDSSATADYIYKACDRLEFELSSNVLDLRFIPDDMEFKHPPRDIATEAPAHYKGLNFSTRSLQQSKVHLSWDEDEPHRMRILRRKYSEQQLEELDFKEFLASDESETDDDDDDVGDENEINHPEKKRRQLDKYRALIQSDNGSDGDYDQDMEVTFNTDLEDISKRILEKTEKRPETVFEAHLRKKREKRRALKNRARNNLPEDENSDTDDHEDEETQYQETENNNKREATREELELLLADEKGAEDSTDVKGYNMMHKKVKGDKKGKEKRRKWKKEVMDESKIPALNDDPRFSGLFTSPLFALDPTDPQFKRSAAYARQLAQKHKQGSCKASMEKPKQNLLPPNDPSEANTDEYSKSDLLSSSKKEKRELSSLVRSLKSKSKPVQLVSGHDMPEIVETVQSSAMVGKEGKNDLSNLVQSVKRKARILRL